MKILIRRKFFSYDNLTTNLSDFTVKINNGELSAESNQPLTIKDIWVME